ncbi:MAG: hypothetical protein QME13_05425, partial [Thermoanaerobacteraceae bacterium]|nr:hypothetical protein [Thermoanaerobacteraceae bacterium]
AEQLQAGFQQLLRDAYSLGGIFRRLLGVHWRWPIFGTLNLIFRHGVQNYLRRVKEAAVP